MRKILLFILSTVMTFSAYAADVTPSRALSIAKSFASGSTGRMKAASTTASQFKLAYTASAADGKNCFYVFSQGTNRGFVIVAADDRANAILGYSDTGDFDYDSMSPEAKHWLKSYVDQITHIRKAGFAENAAPETTLDKEVKPLLGDIQWNQDSPYNDQCPAYGINTQCATGCVATAMAQVMYYHRWPVTGTGQHTYYPSVLGGNPLSADFGSTTYDWDNMLPRYDAASSQASREAVALLMLHCGIAVDMEYSTSSGATSESVPKALATYFNYDKGIAYRTRDNYSNSEWDEVIRHELDNGRPIVALGRSSAGGHAFVFDGYDKNGLVHVNWGWSGMSNGYFRTTALTPAMQGIGGSTSGYNYSQYIVTGIQKPQDNTEEDVELISTEGLVPGQTTVTNGQPVSFRLCGFLANVGWKDSSFDYGLIITDSEGNNVSVVETGTSDELPVGYQIVAPEFKDVRLGTIAEGSYTVYPACRVKGGKGQWNRIRNEYIGYPNHLYMECKDNTITFSYPDYFNLAVSGMEAPGTVYSTVPANTKATITNNGDVDYLGEVTVSIVDKDTKRNVTSGEPYMIDLKPGESIDLSIVDTYTLEPGDYCLTIVDDDNRHIAPYADITVNAAPTTSAVIEPADLLSIAGDEQVDRMAMDITAKVTCKYGVFGGMLYIYLFSENGSVQLGCLDPQYVFLKQGETADVRFTGTFENGVPGTVYTACLMAYNGSTLSFIEPMEMSVCQFRLAGTSGIDGIETSSDEPALIYDISGKRLPYTNIDTLPKGLYIIKQGGKTVKMAK